MAVLDKVLDIGDDAGAKLIMRASEKSKRVNALLAEAGADVRISSFEVQLGVPPAIVFAVESVPGEVGKVDHQATNQ